MPSLKIELETDNAAFKEDENSEIAFVLGQLVTRVLNCDLNDMPANIRDINGNTIGKISYFSD